MNPQTPASSGVILFCRWEQELLRKPSARRFVYWDLIAVEWCYYHVTGSLGHLLRQLNPLAASV